ncbi:MAG TPA: hypothetical protein VHJ58_17575 [Vicinamibacterales bacterium]|nr:hypothetical protein [Vicinamibacterales bacterium]
MALVLDLSDLLIERNRAIRSLWLPQQIHRHVNRVLNDRRVDHVIQQRLENNVVRIGHRHVPPVFADTALVIARTPVEPLAAVSVASGHDIHGAAAAATKSKIGQQVLRRIAERGSAERLPVRGLQINAAHCFQAFVGRLPEVVRNDLKVRRRQL